MSDNSITGTQGSETQGNSQQLTFGDDKHDLMTLSGQSPTPTKYSQDIETQPPYENVCLDDSQCSQNSDMGDNQMLK